MLAWRNRKTRLIWNQLPLRIAGSNPVASNSVCTTRKALTQFRSGRTESQMNSNEKDILKRLDDLERENQRLRKLAGDAAEPTIPTD